MLHDIHAQIAEAVVATLLEYGRYIVVRTGVQELIPQVRVASALGQHLVLPDGLAALPDLLVIDPEARAGVLLEVKFRREISDTVLRGVAAGYKALRTHWPDAVLAVVTAVPPKPTGRYQDHLRILDPDGGLLLETDRPVDKKWAGLSTLGSKFPRVHEWPEFHSDADKALAGLLRWTEPRGIVTKVVGSTEEAPSGG